MDLDLEIGGWMKLIVFGGIEERDEEWRWMDKLEIKASLSLR